MNLVAAQITEREKAILAGLYLSKYDSLGLRRLGFDSFVEAFNAIGYALASKPASIKNYRDEFDPLFANSRKGWHKRPTRQYCREVFDKYRDLDLDSFVNLIMSFFGYDENTERELERDERVDDTSSHFAKRLITGLAAEQYFESVVPQVPEFTGSLVENTTRLGCGFDFRLKRKHELMVLEVKGLKGIGGTLALTPKEHDAAKSFGDQFFLFVVKNFQETPFHQIFRDPLSSALQFKRTERTVLQVSWIASV